MWRNKFLPQRHATKEVFLKRWNIFFWPEIVHTLSLSLTEPCCWWYPLSFTTAWQELGNSSIGKETKLFKRSTIGSVVVPLIICLERGAAIWAHEFGIYIKWNILNTKYMMKHCTTLLPSLRLTFQRQVGREFDCYWADKMSSTSPQLANLKYGQVPSKYSPFALYIIYPNQSYSAALRTFNVEI